MSGLAGWLMARSIDDTSLRAGVRFGIMAVVILPLLPEGPFGPWGGIRLRSRAGLYDFLFSFISRLRIDSNSFRRSLLVCG